MVDMAQILFCWRCYKRQLFRTIDTQELLWVCGECAGVRDLSEPDDD
jgi:hypothetical protein